MIEQPDTKYAKTRDGRHLAYQVCGEGPVDLLFFSLGSSHVEAAWEVPGIARTLRRFASFSRLIRFDHCGTGMSDPLDRASPPSLEVYAEETLAVLDAVGAERVAAVAMYSGGLEAIFFAAAHPDRVVSLVLHGCYARMARAPDYPCGLPPQLLEPAVKRTSDLAEGDAIEFTGLRYLAPRSTQNPEFLAQYRRYVRSSFSPSGARATTELVVYGDVRALLPSVQAPTLVLYRSGDQVSGGPHSFYLAEHIPDARLVEISGEENLLFVDNDADLDEIEEFLTGVRHVPATDRVLATVLFTDIVGSTERAAALGDSKWRELIASHDRAVRRQLERFRGQEVHTTGDGFLARFDGPGRAIECACAVRDAVRTLDLEVRVGLHTGEIEVLGDDIAGLAVHIGARVAAAAGASEVLVSSTVKDLVVGSGFAFADRGEHELKGVPGAWRLFSVEG